ncbi:MAG TPA: pentapeptide repeat-containing protein [Candidatus Dormibacteraeota bacterium]|nr:pentapeptide repeat-containing protein [Candidatus Dormibacteraeota bacterium]
MAVMQATGSVSIWRGSHPTWRTVWAALVAAFWVTILVGVIGGFILHWTWTGFVTNGNLWDWVQLLSAPIFVTALPFIFHGPAAPKSTPTPAATVREQPSVLATYQDHILDLLLGNELATSPPGTAVREVARARTLIVLRAVGPADKGAVVQFLHDADLIDRGTRVIDLGHADLHGADLHEARIHAADLSGADLSGADLSGCDLSDGSLAETELAGANLRGADLRGCEMPASSPSGG